jgi:DNA mismatch endonuclease (patch repair protein)
MVSAARSAQMALVKSKDTAPELRVRQALHAAGLRYRIHDSRLPGKPDLVFPSRRTVLFVHGCFWHQHQGCSRCRTPKSRLDFWVPKLQQNVKRDQKNRAALRRLGWKVIAVWECQTESKLALVRLATKIYKLPVIR